MLADRVKETSATTGTGTLTLGGAAAGFQTFAAGVGNGNKCHYVIENATVPSEWEIGIGTATATPDQLSRDTVLSSSNGGSLVNFSAGTKSVFVSAVANNFEADITDALGSVSGSVTLKVNHYQTITATIGGATTFSFDGWPSAGTPKRSVILTNGGSASVTWPTITWVDGSAPTLQTTGVDRIDIWRTGGVVYGKLIKQAATSGGVTATVTLADNVTVGDFVAALNSGSVEKVKASVSGPSIGSEFIFSTAAPYSGSACFDEAGGRIIVVFSDNGNSGYGTAVVGSISNGTITFGNKYVYLSADPGNQSVSIDPITGKFVVCFSDATASSYGTSVAGTVTGTAISFGSKYVFSSSAAIGTVSSCAIPGVGVGISYVKSSGGNNFCRIATLSGSVISFGSEVQYNSGGGSGTEKTSIMYDAINSKIIVGFSDDSNGGYASAIAASLSGTTPSFGTKISVIPESSSRVSICPKAGGGAVLAAANSAGTAVKSAVLSISGTSLSAGSSVTVNASASGVLASGYDSSNDKIAVFFGDGGNSGYLTAKVGTVSGTSISFGSGTVLNPASSSFFVSAPYITTAGYFASVYQDSGNSGAGTALPYYAVTVSTNAADVCGVATETKSAGQSCAIIPMGAVDNTASGLSVGRDYYITTNGVRTTTAGMNTYVGRALSATQLLLRSIAKR